MFTLKSADIKAALTKFRAAKLPMKGDPAILPGNIVIEYDSTDSVHFLATDMDNWLAVQVPASDVNQNRARGIIVTFEGLNKASKVKNGIFRMFSEDNQYFLENENMKIPCGYYRDPDDYPTWGILGVDLMVEVPAGTLHHALSVTQHAMSRDETRLSLHGCLFEITSDNDAAIVSTDTHRLAKIAISARFDGSYHDDILIQAGAVDALVKLLGKFKNPEYLLNLQIGGKHLELAIGNDSFKTMLIQGKFPTYRTVIPESTSQTIEFDRQQLQDTIAAITTGKKNKFEAVTLQPNCTMVDLSITDDDMQTQSAKIDAVINSEIERVGYNSQYLMDVLKAHQADKITLNFNDDISPCIINDGLAQFVVMPMRV